MVDEAQCSEFQIESRPWTAIARSLPIITPPPSSSRTDPPLPIIRAPYLFISSDSRFSLTLTGRGGFIISISLISLLFFSH